MRWALLFIIILLAALLVFTACKENVYNKYNVNEYNPNKEPANSTIDEQLPPPPPINNPPISSSE